MGINMRKIWRDVDKDIKRQTAKQAAEWDARVEKGDVDAILEVARQYWSGLLDRKRNEKKAIELLEKGVELGDARCAMEYANKLALGIKNNVLTGREPYYGDWAKKVDDKTREKVFSLYQFSAEKGTVFAMEIMVALEKSPAKKAYWRDRAAENGSWKMQLEKVKEYANKDNKQSAVWLKKLLDNKKVEYSKIGYNSSANDVKLYLSDKQDFYEKSLQFFGLTAVKMGADVGKDCVEKFRKTQNFDDLYVPYFDGAKLFEYVSEHKDDNWETAYLYACCKDVGFGCEKDKTEAFAVFQKLASDGKARAQRALGDFYYDGDVVEQDYLKAVEWYKKSAEQGCPAGQNALGYCYYFGRGVEKNEEKGKEWYEKSALQGFATAQRNLGIFYEENYKDYESAVKWYQKAIDGGDGISLRRLGCCYIDGTGVPKDEKKGFDLIESLALREDSQGIYMLAICYEKGYGVAKDLNKAVALYENSALKGHVFAQAWLGDYYRKEFGNIDYAKAIKWYTMATENGDSESQLHLGYMYGNGLGVQQDWTKAAEFFEKAAQSGNAIAMYDLGWCYYFGKGVKQDYAKAVDYFAKATLKGNGNAMNRLAICYANGQGVPKDEKKAFELAQMAGLCGCREALTTLAMFYMKGIGVNVDYNKGFELYKKASDEGDACGTYNLSLCYEGGYGTLKNPALAKQLREKAIKNGYVIEQ